MKKNIQRFILGLVLMVTGSSNALSQPLDIAVTGTNVSAFSTMQECVSKYPNKGCDNYFGQVCGTSHPIVTSLYGFNTVKRIVNEKGSTAVFNKLYQGRFAGVICRLNRVPASSRGAIVHKGQELYCKRSSCLRSSNTPAFTQYCRRNHPGLPIQIAGWEIAGKKVCNEPVTGAWYCCKSQ